MFQYLHCRERVLTLKKDNKWECGRGADRGSTVDDVTTGGVYISGKSTKVGMLEKLTLEKSRKKKFNTKFEKSIDSCFVPFVGI